MRTYSKFEFDHDAVSTRSLTHKSLKKEVPSLEDSSDDTAKFPTNDFSNNNLSP